MRAAVLLALCSCAAAEPPSLEYGWSRTSTALVKTPMGNLPVDQGLDWQGIRVYLSLFGDLIAVDPATGRVLWNEGVGYFWKRMTFREVETEAGPRAWAVELRPRPTEEEGRDLVQLHELRTGKVLPAQGASPPGTAVTVGKAWHGRNSRLARPFVAAVTTETNWKELLRRMFEGVEDAPKTEPVDFTRERVLAVSEGACWGVTGISPAEVRESPERVLIRLRHHTYQILTAASAPLPEPPPDRPFGLFVLPLGPAKPIVFETNRQPYISGPAIWKEKQRFMPPADPARELDEVPR